MKNSITFKFGFSPFDTHDGNQKETSDFQQRQIKKPQANHSFFSASLLPPPKKPKLFHCHRFFTPRQRTPWFLQTGPPLPPLLPTPRHLQSQFLRSAHKSWTDVLLFQCLHCDFPPPQVSTEGDWELHICNLFSEKFRPSSENKPSEKTIRVSAKLTRERIIITQQRRNFFRHPLRMIDTSRGGFQRMKTNTLSHISSIDVDSHSNIDKTVHSQTTPVEKRIAYNNQELLAWRFHCPQSKEVVLVCARYHIILGGARPKDRTGPPPSLDWIPYINRRINQVRFFRREASIAVMNKDDLSDNTLGVPVFLGLSPCATHRLLVPLPQFGHKKCHHSKDIGAHSGNSKRFRSDPTEIGRHLNVFSAHSLQDSLKNNQRKRKFTFDEKGQPLKH